MILVLVVALFASILSSNIVVAGSSHGVIGQVLDSYDGTSADGSDVTAYIATRPTETLTTTVSGNYYDIDVGNFPTPWSAGEELDIEIYKDSQHQIDTSVILTSSGYDVAPTVRLPGEAEEIKIHKKAAPPKPRTVIINFTKKSEWDNVNISKIDDILIILSNGEEYNAKMTKTDTIKRIAQFLINNVSYDIGMEKYTVIDLNKDNRFDVKIIARGVGFYWKFDFVGIPQETLKPKEERKEIKPKKGIQLLPETPMPAQRNILPVIIIILIVVWIAVYVFKFKPKERLSKISLKDIERELIKPKIKPKRKKKK